MDGEDAGIVKTLRKERIIADRKRAYDRGDLEAVQGTDKLIEKCQARRHAARARKKQREAKFLNKLAQIEGDRATDTPSDSERS